MGQSLCWDGSVKMTAQVEDRLWKLRPGKPEDHNLVLSSWIRSQRSNSVGHQGDASSYGEWQERLIKRLLQRCALLIAAYDSDPDYILGWACTSTGAVHYVWVRDGSTKHDGKRDYKGSFRRRGIASDLLRPYLDKPTIFTHRFSDACRKMSWDLGLENLSYPKGWVYDAHHAYNLAFRESGE